MVDAKAIPALLKTLDSTDCLPAARAFAWFARYGIFTFGGPTPEFLTSNSESTRVCRKNRIWHIRHYET